MSAKSKLPQVWKVTSSSREEVYPRGGEIEFGPSGDLHRLDWNDQAAAGRSLDGLTHIHIGEIHRLHSAGATGSDKLPYSVEIEITETAVGFHFEGVVGPSPSGSGDPGDLSGTWGADAPRPMGQ